MLAKRTDEFNQALNRSTAIMPGLTGAMKMQLAQSARLVGLQNNLAVSATDAAKAYFFLASAGKSAEQSQRLLADVLTFAQAGNFDAALATDLLTDAQSALRLTSQDLAQDQINLRRIGDVLVKGNTLFNSSVQQLSEALTNKAAASAVQAKIELEDLVGVLGALADQGIKGSDAGTAFNIILRDLQTKAIQNKQAFKDFGVEVFESGEIAGGVSGAIRSLSNAMVGLSTEQKKSTLLQLGFSDKSVAFIQVLLGLSDKMDGYTDSVKDAGGTMKEVAENQLTPLEKAMARFGQILDNYLQTVAAPLLESFSNWLLEMSRSQEGLASLGKTVGTVADIIHVMRVGASVAALGLSAIWRAATLLSEGLHELLGLLGIVSDETVQMARDASSAAVKSFEEQEAQMMELWNQKMPGEALTSQLTALSEELTKSIEPANAGEEIGDTIGKSIGKGIEEASPDVLAALDGTTDAMVADIKSFADRTKRDLMTPFELYKEQIDKIRQAEVRGMLDPDEAKQARAGARDDFQEKQFGELKQFAEQTKQAVSTPFQDFKAEQEKLREAMGRGLLNPSEFARANAQNKLDLIEGLNGQQAEEAEKEDMSGKAVSGLAQGSADAFSAIMAASRRGGNTPESQTAKNTKFLAEEARKQTEHLRRLEKASDVDTIESLRS